MKMGRVQEKDRDHTEKTGHLKTFQRHKICYDVTITQNKSDMHVNKIFSQEKIGKMMMTIIAHIHLYSPTIVGCTVFFQHIANYHFI